MPNPAEIFAKRCRQRMEEIPLSVTELAQRLGVASSNVSAYLSGRKPVGFKILNAYAQALEVDPNWLIDRTQKDTVRFKELSEEELAARVIAKLGIDPRREKMIQLILAADTLLLDTLDLAFAPHIAATSKQSKPSAG